ncbi:MAG: cation-translocating P-type ATPase [Planctomycetaceae bacterium]
MTSTVYTPGECDYCGLPLPRPLFRRARSVEADVSTGPRFCCSGCRFAAAVTQEKGEAGEAGWTLAKLGISIFFAMSVMVFTFSLWSFDVYDAPASENERLPLLFASLLRWLGLIFSVPVLLLLGQPLAEEAWAGLRKGVWSSDLLLLTGVVAAFAYSVSSVLRGDGAVYFETACVILVFVTLGRWLAARGRAQSTATLDQLQRLLPEQVRRQHEQSTEEIPLDDVRIGDVLVIRAGERIPVDGEIVSGESSIDEQVFTGESVPVDARPGQHVHAGTLNVTATLCLRATAAPRAGAFGRLLEAVRAARDAQGRYQTTADRFATLFFPIIAVVAAATFIVHGLLRSWTDGGLAALSVVLIACPCALALATPLAVWAALGRAAQRGVLFCSGEAIERLADINAVRFDKTGTLTTGTPQVVSLVIATDSSREQIAARCLLMTAESTHVFSRSIQRFLRADAPSRLATADVETIAGSGLLWQPDDATDETIRLGSWSWLQAEGVSADDAMTTAWRAAEQAAHSVVAIAWDNRVQAIFEIAEETRRGALDALATLRSRGLDIAMLTGDHPARAARLSQELGLPAFAALTPEGKASELTRLRRSGSRVAMVGDGINDAPALAAADVGIALGCGTDITRDSADVCLLGDDLTTLPWAIELARETVQVIRGNLAWAFGYNAIGVCVAAAGWLHPSVAAVLMVVSSVAVIARSIRLGQCDTVNELSTQSSKDACGAIGTPRPPTDNAVTEDDITAAVSTIAANRDRNEVLAC